ncbi:MAG: PEP-CTERM sorting domain-containing protein [Bryobacteraceae bacterium]
MFKSAKLPVSTAVPIRYAVLLATVAFGCVFSSPAKATTIDTYDFIQQNYSPVVTTIEGTFTGVPNAAGFITLSSLISTNFTPAFFSFDINGGNSSLDLAANVPTTGFNNSVYCIGAAAAFGGNINGVNCGPGGSNGYIIVAGFTEVSKSQPVVTLVNSYTTVSEPSSLVLMSVALASLAMLLRRRSTALRG